MHLNMAIIELHGDRATSIVEKPRRMRGKPEWINAGMYVLDGDVFEAIDKTGSSKRAEYELTTSLQLLIKRWESNQCCSHTRV